MTPNNKGRFCDNCSKTVIDFSAMSDTEIKNYLIAKKGEGVCGHFRTSQLQNITITIPSRVLFSQTQFRKIFMLALLLIMGTTLLSCSDNAGNKQKIEKVVIEGETVTYEDTEIPLPPPEQLSPTVVKDGEFLDGAVVVYEADSVTACKTTPKLSHTAGKVAIQAPLKADLYLTGEVAPEFEEEKENNHIFGDTIITPQQ